DRVRSAAKPCAWRWPACGSILEGQGPSARAAWLVGLLFLGAAAPSCFPSPARSFAAREVGQAVLPPTPPTRSGNEKPRAARKSSLTYPLHGPAEKRAQNAGQSQQVDAWAGWTWGVFINHGADESRFPDNFDEQWRVVIRKIHFAAFCQKPFL